MLEMQPLLKLIAFSLVVMTCSAVFLAGHPSAAAEDLNAGKSNTEAVEPFLNYSREFATSQTEIALRELEQANYEAAERRLLSAIEAWPIYLGAWNGLIRLYRATDNEPRLQTSHIIAEWIELYDAHPPRSAAAIWRNAEAPRSAWKAPDPIGHEMASKIVAFYSAEDARQRKEAATQNQEWADKNQRPFWLRMAPAVLIGGIIAAVQ